MGETARDKGGDDTVMVGERDFDTMGEEMIDVQMEQEIEDVRQEEGDMDISSGHGDDWVWRRTIRAPLLRVPPFATMSATELLSICRRYVGRGTFPQTPFLRLGVRPKIKVHCAYYLLYVFPTIGVVDAFDPGIGLVGKYLMSSVRKVVRIFIGSRSKEGEKSVQSGKRPESDEHSNSG
ncbi:hypothetical protein M9H77_21426 [Catharanthus roseus]|uniref:Uncharacterized protein n=1 Tax=Catharanthus roseus TaxID=4058 RepID=A0ACC0AQ83_CATRO|nr:hypothetical protein M9H77_21426 [Catharanthus roseus]